jgi:hypoxanthine phosphoribosyltransferase
MPRKKKPSSSQRNEEAVHPLISRAQIQQRITKMAREIRKDFSGKPLHLVAVLKGSVFFLTDLMRQIPGEVSLDFIAVSSYGNDRHSSGEVKLTKDLDSSIEGKNVILIEDVLDTGATVHYLLRVLKQRRPKCLRVAVLLNKPEHRTAPVQPDYVGFTIPNRFVVGYGLDLGERHRNLSYVGVLKSDL